MFSVKSLIKVVVSIVMIGLVLSLVDLTTLLHTLKNLPLWLVLTVIAGYYAGQGLSAYKWYLLAKSGGIDLNFGTALKSYFIGMYVNCFGLGILGGDMTRALLISKGKPQKTESITSVVADRAHGLAILALLGTTSTLLFGHNTLEPEYLYLLLLIGFGIFSGWFLGPKILLRIVTSTSKLRAKAEQVTKFFSNDSKVLVNITLLSLLFHLLQVGLHFIIVYALGAQISWQYLLVVIPFVNIASSLPISWNGLGVRETAYIFFFCGSKQLLTEEQAVAMGVTWLVAVTATSALGGVIAFLTNDFKQITAQNQTPL